MINMENFHNNQALSVSQSIDNFHNHVDLGWATGILLFHANLPEHCSSLNHNVPGHRISSRNEIATLIFQYGLRLTCYGLHILVYGIWWVG